MTTELTEQILASLNKEVLNHLRLASIIAHPGESGRAREETIAVFLRKLLPQSYGISSGFVFDAKGVISRQIDLVIYRDDYHPVFEIGGIKHFMIESVAAVIENKARVHTRELRIAFENIRSVKGLDRTNGGQNTVRGPSAGPTDMANPCHQVLGIIVSSKLLQPKQLLAKMGDMCQSIAQRDLWPNVYVDVERFVVTHAQRNNETTEAGSLGRTWFTNRSRALALWVPNDSPTSQPLIALAGILASFLRSAPVIDYMPADYFGLGTTRPVAIHRFVHDTSLRN